MKQIYLVLAVLLNMSFSALGQNKAISANELPAEATTYIKKHFPESKILKATKETELLKTEYDVLLDNKLELSFNAKGEITEIEGKHFALPASVIPEKMLKYTKEHYASNFITAWKQKYKKQEIELDNGLDIVFNAKGDFLRIDD